MKQSERKKQKLVNNLKSSKISLYLLCKHNIIEYMYAFFITSGSKLKENISLVQDGKRMGNIQKVNKNQKHTYIYSPTPLRERERG